MRHISTIFLMLIGLSINAQNWQALDPDENKVGLELNPLKGIAANFGSDNGFPHSISNLTLSFGEISTDVEGVFDFSEIDEFLDEQALEGRYGIIQVNIDDGKLINPNIDDYFDAEDLDEDGNPTRDLEAYKGAQHNLPGYLNSVDRAYYLGNRCQGCATGTDDFGNVIEPYAGAGLDPQGIPSLVVNYNDPDMVAAMEDFIQQLGDRYDEDGRLFIVHYGLYGIFGEWKLGFGERYVPVGQEWAMSDTNKDLITREYSLNFLETNLIARFPSTVYEPQSVGYSDGLYFGGSFNDADPNQSGFFLRELKLYNSQENWRNQPMGGEMDPYLQGSIWGNDPAEDILQKVIPTGDPTLVVPSAQKIDEVFERTHPTFIFQNYMLKKDFVGLEGGNHSVPQAIIEAGAGDLVRFNNQFPFLGENNQVFWDNAKLAVKKSGYTFHLDQFRLSAQNGKPAVEVNIKNLGVAPMYANWDVEFGYLNNGAVESLGKFNSWSLNTILPNVTMDGQIIEDNSSNNRSFISDVTLPNTEGTYTFVLRIVNPLSEGVTLPDGTFKTYPNAEPVRFANATQDNDVEGWLTLGQAKLSGGDLATLPQLATSLTGGAYNDIMNLGTEQQLSVTSNPTDIDITWSSNRPLTAAVDQNGMVSTFDDRGVVTITAATSNGINVDFEITVTAIYELPALMQAEGYSDISVDEDDNNPFNDFGEIVVTEGDDQGALTLQRFKSNSYIDFDVIVNQEEDFIFDFKAASFGGAADAKLDIILLSDNSSPLGSIELNRPAGGSSFDVYFSDAITLTAGTHTLRFAVAEGKTAFNLDWIRIRRDDPCEFPGFAAGEACEDNNGNTIDDTYEEFPDCRCVGIPGSDRQLIIPGIVEAEHWSSVSANTFNAEGMIETTSTDPSEVITMPKYSPTVEGGDGYFVGGLQFLDRLNYQVDATLAGDYILDFRVASPQLQGTNIATGQFTIKVDGVTVQADFQLMDTDGPNTDPNDFGDYSIYNIQPTEPIELTLGLHTVQLEVTIGSFDLNYIDFRHIPEVGCVVGDPCDDGNPATINDTYNSECECVGIIDQAYTLIPSLIEAEDYSDAFTVQINPAPSAEGGGDILGFIADETWIEYEVQVTEEDDFILDVRASSPFGIGVVDLLNEAGDVLTTVNLGPIVEANSFDAYGTFSSESFSLPVGSYTLRVDVVTSAFNLNWIEFRLADGCENPVGMACDDGNPATINDTYNSECECVGIIDQAYTLIPSLIEAEDYSDAFTVQVNPAPSAEGGGDILGFIADETWIEYEVEVTEEDDFILDVRASSPYGIGVVNLLNAAGDVLTTVNLGPIVEADNFDTYGTFSSEAFSLPAGSYTLRVDVVTSAFNLNWIEFRLAEGCENPEGTLCDDGDEATTNDMYNAACECVGTIPQSYTLIPSLIEAEDYSDVFTVQVNPAPATEGGGDILGFIADETWIEYAVEVTEEDDFILDVRASSPYGIGVVNLLNAAGDVLTTVNLGPIVEADNFDAYGTFSSETFSLPAGSYTLRVDVVTSAFNLNWIEFRLADGCENPVGTACDDGDPCTTGDVYTGDCGCAGTFADSDEDGVCDADDVCSDLDDNLIGTACDDGDPCTTGDVYTGDCGCAGTFADSDEDGVCDADDVCSDLDDNLIGTACDDDDACTTGDVYTVDCGCAGTFADSDEDGVCDADDVCADLDDNLIGMTCDDGDACTTGDVYTADCGCAGTFADADADGVCDADDVCGDLDDNLIGMTCDDGDACTTGDVYTTDCGCAGTFADSDEDGVCDADDVCTDLDDNLIGTTCDDGDANTINDVYTANCICEGTSTIDVTLDAIHDSYLQGSTNKNSDILRVEDDYRTSYLKFDLSDINGTVNSVDLVFTVADDPGHGLIQVSKGDHTDWTETNLSNSNKPTATALLGEMDGTYLKNQTYTWNLSAEEIEASEITFIVRHISGNDVSFKSSENSDVGDRPKLIVNYSCDSDSDGDGVCDANDICPDFDDSLIGTPCDDGDTATTNDVYTSNCDCSGIAEQTVAYFDAIHDSYLQGSSNKNTDILRVEDDYRTTYMKFDLSGITGDVSSVDLVLIVANDPGNGLIRVSKGDHIDWTETNLSNANKPEATTVLGEMDGTYFKNETYTWNLSASDIELSEITFIIEHISGNDVSFRSSESSNSGLRPYLIVEYAASGGNDLRVNNEIIVEGLLEKEEYTIEESKETVSRNQLKDHIAFPNPFLDRVTLKLNEHIEYKRILIQDLNGGVINSINSPVKFESEELNIQIDGPSGMYLMLIETTDGVEVKKIVKM